ncbi:hypothetical protein [Polyangium aurulentum]|uniref:hypothetical protein n=1 Tax=Polyangium aurulentum TaxID=2567896 RepID=UPI0010ADC06E|nr:hypothetical protein [Polyangium aurulentum]UQA54960.1 hypothetical protein E8A73_026760 [Polyangium aurulentum]
MRSDRAFFLRWLFACGFGELLGLAVAAAGMWMSARAGEPVTLAEKLAVLFGMIGAGILEGAITGTLQWLVLRRRYPALGGAGWVGATVLVAALGWAAGMSIPLFFVGDAAAGAPAPVEPPMALVLVFAAIFGAAAGALFGLAQGLVLRRHVKNALLVWVAGNAAGWAIGLPFTYLAGGLDLGNVAAAAAVGGASGLVMGFAVAAATGMALRALPPAHGPTLAPT